MSDWQNWQTAFLQQARCDWDAYQRTHQTTWASCHRLLFLQMATEKLSKALLIAGHSKLETMAQSHAAFVNFMRVVGDNRKLQEALGMKKAPIESAFQTAIAASLRDRVACSGFGTRRPKSRISLERCF